MQTELGQGINTASPADSIEVSSPTEPSRKRKAPSSGSRGVATLTPDQLAKKRANDREAQRAIRERTKQTIEALERRIEDLTAQQPYQELQAAVREKEAVQAENNEIRRRLSSILSLIQPIVGSQGLAELATTAHQNAQAQNNVYLPDSYVNGNQRPRPAPPPAQDQSSYSTYTETGPETSQTWHASRDALGQQRDNLRRGLELTENGERLSFNFLLDNGQRPPTSTPAHQSHYQSPSQPVPYYNFASSPSAEQRPWNTLPRNCEATCPLDHILLNLYQKVRRESSTPGSPSSFPHVPVLPSVMSLLNPSHSVDTLSQTMADITTKFPHINTIPNRVATVWLMFIYARWAMFPTQENYDRMPEWLHPRSSQLLTPHPVWIDYLAWPLMRDKVISDYKHFNFDNWFIPYTIGMSVNWPYGATDCLLSTPEHEEAVINPVFEKHIRKLDNWSVAPLLIETFPALKGTCTVKVQDPSAMTER